MFTNFLSTVAVFLVMIGHAQKNQAPMRTTNHAVEIIRYTIAGSNQHSFEEVYRKACTVLQSSPYCLGYEIIHGAEDPSSYIVRIHWTSTADHMNGFRRSKEFMTFFNLVKPFYNDIQEMKHYEQTPLV